MNEIDFDELDKAVSSLMNKNQKRIDDNSDAGSVAVPNTPIADDPKPESYNTVEPETVVLYSPEETADTNNGLSGAEKLELNQTEEESTVELKDTSDTTAPRSNREVPHRVGRFMDVKHDSLSMRTASSSVSRHGATIQPVSAVPESVEPAKNEASDSVEVSKEDSQAVDSIEAPISPFLTDAKVEKRPLGRPKKDTANKKVDEPEGDAPDQAMVKSELDSDEPVGMPEELQPDLVSIEAGADTKAIDTPEEPGVGQAESTEQQSKVDLSKELAPEQSEVPAPIEEAKPTGPVSIPQQYKETPSSQPQDNGTIYDTENYHQPITHPAKKSSGWMIVVWIVLIILLGASLGVAAYFSGLI